MAKDTGGVRLHHKTLKNCVLAIEAVRPYKEPYQCPLCGMIHLNKTVHLTLDGNGDVIVSKVAWKELKDLPGLPLEVANEVTKPPALILSLNGERTVVDIHEIPFEGRR